MPAAPDRQDFRLEKWSRLTFVGAPRQPGRLVFGFVGTFACVAVADGVTQVTHSYEFNFRAPFRWLERRMAEPLQAELTPKSIALGTCSTERVARSCPTGRGESAGC